VIKMTRKAGIHSGRRLQPKLDRAGKTAVVDATGLVLGRLASHLAKRLMAGETIHVVNAEKAVVTGTKDAIMERFNFKRDVGTRRKGPFYPRVPHMMVKRTVRGMLSYQETPTHRAAYRRLTCHIGVPDALAGQKAETIEKAKVTAPRRMTIGAIAQELGAKF
jgi:large subunit ribosomal protein L13